MGAGQAWAGSLAAKAPLLQSGYRGFESHSAYWAPGHYPISRMLPWKTIEVAVVRATGAQPFP